MVKNRSHSSSSGAGGTKSSQTDVINLVSDDEVEDEEEENQDDDDDDDEEVRDVNSAPRNDCLLVEFPHRKDRDINDNTGSGSGAVEKRVSLFERRSYQNDSHIPAVPSEMSSPGASFSRLTIYQRRSIHRSPEPRATVCPPTPPSARHSESTACSPRTPSTSGIILNRAYNKTPSTGTSTDEFLRVDSPLLQPIVQLENIRDCFSLSDNGFTIPWHNRHGNERARSSMSNTSRNYTPRTNFLRRSFHKVTTSPSKIPTIDLEQESSATPDTASFSTSARRDFVQDLTLFKRSAKELPATIDLDAQPTEECMDVVEVEETCGKPDIVVASESSSSSSNIELVNVVEPDSASTANPAAIANATADASMEPLALSSANDEEANDETSSMGTTYGDVSSAGCLKNISTRDSVGHRQGVEIGAGGRQPLNEFDLLLLKINETTPPMSHQDRIDQWRVTADDLLHSIPTKAAIETSSTCAKRPLDGCVHVSSDDDSDDNLDADTGGPCARANKKRRTLEAEEEEQSEAAAHLPEVDLPHGGATGGLDFRKSQINPEIDKPPPHTGANAKSMIMERRNYHKLPTRYREEDPWSAQLGYTGRQRSLADGVTPGNPYAQLLNRVSEERDTFLSYLKISPFFRTDEKALASGRSPDARASNEAAPPGREQLPKNGINMKPAVSGGSPINRLKPCRPLQTKQRGKRERKKSVKNKAHPSVIASSGLRGARRLVLSSSLRNGKVIRYRNNILHTLAKPKPKLANVAPRTKNGNDAAGSDSTISSGKEKDAKKRSASSVRSASLASPVDLVDRNDPQHRSMNAFVPSPVPSSSSSTGKKPSQERCSVDSAVSSSTSAEMRHIEKLSKGCQTMDATIDRREPLAPPPTVNDGKRLRNPVARSDGEILHLFLLDEQLIVVQKELVSFWKYSRLSVLLGVKQDWQRVGQIQRWNRDTEVDIHNSNRIVYNHTNPVYLEPRARNLNDDKSRACPLASIYVNAYFLDMAGNVPTVSTKTYANGDAGAETHIVEVWIDESDELDELLRRKSYQLDTVKSALEDIRLMPLPNARDFIVCWHEHVSEMESCTGLCKYSLTPDLDSLGCIRQFAVVKQRVHSFRCMNDRKLLGLGQSTVHIWCFESGYLLRTVDLKIEIGLIMGAFLHIEADENTLIMLQLQQPPEPASNHRKLVKVIAVNLSKPSWYIAHSYEIALTSMSITGESPIWNMDESNASARHCVTFDSGELLLVSLADPTACWTNHQRLEKDLERAKTGAVNICSRLRSNSSNELYRPRERILNGSNWNGGRDLVFLSEQLLTTKTIDEYMMERAKDK
uniref:Uncharacterized protein n=1 Tax=Anopheles atroparvus TaxID=41427 RepID=A0A182J1Z3_ANOAO